MRKDIVDELKAYEPELIEIRRDIHRHPETGFEEMRTAALVAAKLRGWGIEVAEGIGKTGVVGTIKGNKPGQRAIGLRADLDALHIQEIEGRALSLDGPRQDARLRPRRPHDHAARRGALSGRASRFRRRRAFHLPARRGGPRRRQGDGRGGAVRALPGRRRLRHAQCARACRSARSPPARDRSWRRATSGP